MLLIHRLCLTVTKVSNDYISHLFFYAYASQTLPIMYDSEYLLLCMESGTNTFNILR